MKHFGLPKSGLLRKGWQFREVYKRGARIKGKHFSLIFIHNNEEQRRLGISVHGVKKAVKRNRIKRIIREYFRLNTTAFPENADIVFAVRNGFEPDSPHDIDLLIRQRIKNGLPNIVKS